MTTENLNLKVNDVIVGNDGMGDRIGYYRETKSDKRGDWVIYASSINGKSAAVYVRSMNNVRLATSEEIAAFKA